MEVINHVGKCAENKKPNPDFYVNPERVLLTLYLSSRVCFCLRHLVPLPKIKECEDKNPNQIDEVPIKTHGFDDLVIAFAAGEKAAPFHIVVAAVYFAGD
mgnify:CR=1 FL=1|jgi:hypothetical protein